MPKSKGDIGNRDPIFSFHISDTDSGIASLNLRDLYQIILLRKGKINYHASGSDHAIPGRHIIFIPPETSFPITHSLDSEMIQIAFGRQFLETIYMSSIEEKALQQFNLESPDAARESSIAYIPLSDAASAEISQLAAIMLHEYGEKNHGYQSMIRIKFMELLLTLYRANPPPETDQESGPAGKNINDIIGFVNERYSDNLTLNEIARQSGLNPSYLSRAFREATGMALFEYINRIRIQKSCMLLKQTSLSIIEIAYSVGYNNISRFNRYFRRTMRMSPRQYKNYIKG